MVAVVTGEVCVYKYCGVYDVSFAVCYNYRADLFYLFADPYDLFTGSVFYRIGSGRLYHTADGSSAERQCHDDQSGNYRILYFEDL